MTLVQADDSLVKYFIFVTIMFCLLILGAARFSEYLVAGDLEGKINIKVIKSAVRVDLVGMPKFTLQELKQMEPADFNKEPVQNIEQKQEAIPKDVVKLQDEKADKKPSTNFLNKIKNLSKKNNVKVVKEKPKKNEKPVNLKKLNNLILEGNKISKGTALSGKQTEQNLTVLESYLNNITQFVRPHWKLPSYLKNNTELRCRIRIFINKSGKIFKSEILEPSGEPQYDSLAQTAISRTTLPAPPVEIVPSLVKGVAVLGFPL